ncbi:MAG TPA: hypothetical protein VFO16_14085 [Pseudonocardiaceae bacterium]|nr:hypothetical protein [Pseudonocardiaceae bacterium]
MQDYTIVGIYMDNHEPIVRCVRAASPIAAENIGEDKRPYDILAVFDGRLTDARHCGDILHVEGAHFTQCTARKNHVGEHRDKEGHTWGGERCGDVFNAINHIVCVLPKGHAGAHQDQTLKRRWTATIPANYTKASEGD